MLRSIHQNHAADNAFKENRKGEIVDCIGALMGGQRTAEPAGDAWII
jgi:hypothetical protein